ncbi:MAG: phospho-sugar mutase [Nitriliruptorales bacterium]|nr:phospho-sugar mutase [Nitriliruptorales bacterium]
MNVDIVEDARRWLDADPDPDTRAELQALLDAGDVDGLRARFGVRLEFGTAGIRGPMGAGPAQFNRMVVRRVTAGLAARLLEGDVDSQRGVVVGHDARHKSAVFARDAAAVLAAAGIPVHCLPGTTPTPLVAFAVRDLGAAAGVQITASHNPAADNGYKVYWSDGAQILPPLDAEISAAIDAVAADADVPMADEGISEVDPTIVDRYCDAILPLATGGATRLRIVYTPMHGVAGQLMHTVFDRAGFSDVTIVAAQADPDPDFPTVSFPNPEEPGALDLAFETADEVDADLILAHDPDGDRIAAAVYEGRWRALNGDEIGCLLAEWLLTNGPDDDGRLVGTTVVSSRLLAAIAHERHVGYVETLTGFKWLARAALEADQRGERMVLAYEQALGAMCGTAVLDKDGISAALVLSDMAASLREKEQSLTDVLDDLARRHGAHVTGGRNIRLEGDEGAALVVTTLERLRSSPPDQVAGVDVVAVADYAAGTTRRSDGTGETLTTPPTDLVGLLLADGSRLQVRPSGTEPLLKFYAEVIETVGTGEAVLVAHERGRQRLDELVTALLSAVGI